MGLFFYFKDFFSLLKHLYFKLINTRLVEYTAHFAYRRRIILKELFFFFFIGTTTNNNSNDDNEDDHSNVKRASFILMFYSVLYFLYLFVFFFFWTYKRGQKLKLKDSRGFNTCLFAFPFLCFFSQSICSVQLICIEELWFLYFYFDWYDLMMMMKIIIMMMIFNDFFLLNNYFEVKNKDLSIVFWYKFWTFS